MGLRRKMLRLNTAAASGCEANAEVAWQLPQLHVSPQLLQTSHYRAPAAAGHKPGAPTWARPL